MKNKKTNVGSFATAILLAIVAVIGFTMTACDDGNGGGNPTTFTVTFNANGGNAVPSQTVASGGKATEPQNVARGGYTIVGWYKDNGTFQNQWDFAADTVTADITLYAKWNQNAPEPFNGDINDLAAWLSARSGGASAGDPFGLSLQFDLGTMTEADSGWRKLLTAIETAGKFVNLDLSACTMNGTAFNPDYTVTTGKDKIVGVALPNTAVSIVGVNVGNYAAFSNFTALTAFSGAGLTSIGGYAFYLCSSLTLTSLPAGLTSIGNNAFYMCTNLALTSLPAGITSIDNNAFSGCLNLALSSLPEGLTSIGGNAFYMCTKLALTSLPEGLTSIGGLAFDGCKGITSLTIPETVTTIDGWAFNGWTAGQTITVPFANGATPSGWNANWNQGCNAVIVYTASVDSALNGTWVSIDGEKIVLNNGDMTISQDNVEMMKGTYSTAANTITMTLTQVSGASFGEEGGPGMGLSLDQWYTEPQLRAAVIPAMVAMGLTQAQAEETYESDLAYMFVPQTGTYTLVGNTLTMIVDGETTVLTRQDSSFVPQYSIGDTGPGGGKIFYVSTAGFTVEMVNPAQNYTAHYLEGAPVLYPAYYQWGNASAIINGITTFTATTDPLAQKIGNGRKDTQIIISNIPYNETERAAQMAESYGTWFGYTGGKDDWFLPSLGELAILYQNRDAANLPPSASNMLAWSSSQTNATYAWRFGFNGISSNSAKSGTAQVYPIRAF